MTRQMVGYDLKAIQRRWREDTSRNLDEDKARELAKLDELERTHWQAWEDSLEQVTTESSARTTSGRGNGDGSVTEQAAIRREGKQGNPAYLRGRDGMHRPAVQAARAGLAAEAGAQR